MASHEGSVELAISMVSILGTMCAVLGGFVMMQTVDKTKESSFLADPQKEPSKYAYEMYCLIYTVVWIVLFGCIVVFQLYEQFDATAYNTVTFVLALPLYLQPILFPSAGSNSPDQHRPLGERYSTKANLWLAVYGFIGNYWYTHYFYSVLKASYTMPAVRLNNVPICMFFATHFYFSTYHVFSNMLLRKVRTSFQKNSVRSLLYVGVIVVFSYFTAFMESITISSFPYYSFEDIRMAYTVGSAFYGIYFLVSFPAFYEFDTEIDSSNNKSSATLWETVVQSCGYGMMIMFLLDFVRLYLDIPLVVGVIA